MHIPFVQFPSGGNVCLFSSSRASGQKVHIEQLLQRNGGRDNRRFAVHDCSFIPGASPSGASDGLMETDHPTRWFANHRDCPPGEARVGEQPRYEWPGHSQTARTSRGTRPASARLPFHRCALDARQDQRARVQDHSQRLHPGLLLVLRAIEGQDGIG
jgi:hypothetical protein